MKGVGFDSWRRIGTALPAVKVYCKREVDELVLVDITATAGSRLVDIEEVDSIADECFMPLTVGGGVKSIDDFRKILRAGADKVSINSSAIETPELISEAAQHFGSQCVIVSIDYRVSDSGKPRVFTHCGQRDTGRDLIEWAGEVASLGAGEILLTSVERDGTMNGYDVGNLKKVVNVVDVPVIAAGGAGSPDDMAKAVLSGGASAVAAASMFHFTHITPKDVKNHFVTRGINVRI